MQEVSSMSHRRKWLSKTAGIGESMTTSGNIIRFTVVLLIMIITSFLLGSCGFFDDGESDTIVTGGQSWSGRNWDVRFDEARWSGCRLSVDVTITNTGNNVATFGNYGEEDPGLLYVVDKFSQVFEPDKLWPWEKHFYEEKFYPNESRDGTLEYDVDARSESVWMMMTPIFPEVGQLSFDLGAVPDSCE
jgi:hypothetical protein